MNAARPLAQRKPQLNLPPFSNRYFQFQPTFDQFIPAYDYLTSRFSDKNIAFIILYIDIDIYFYISNIIQFYISNMSISLLGVLEQANAPEYIDFHNISFNDGADKFFGK